MYVYRLGTKYGIRCILSSGIKKFKKKATFTKIDLHIESAISFCPRLKTTVFCTRVKFTTERNYGKEKKGHWFFFFGIIRLFFYSYLASFPFSHVPFPFQFYSRLPLGFQREGVEICNSCHTAINTSHRPPTLINIKGGAKGGESSFIDA